MYLSVPAITAAFLTVLSVTGQTPAGEQDPAAETAKKAPTDPLHRESPQTSVAAFLEDCHSGNSKDAWRYLDLKAIPYQQRSQRGPELTAQLCRVLDHDAQFDVAALSHEPQGNPSDGAGTARVDSFYDNGQKLELTMTRASLRSGLEVWRFSPESIALIPKLVRATSDSPIERHLPEPMLSIGWAGMAVWRWIALLILALVLLPVARLLSRVLLIWPEKALRHVAPRVSELICTLVGPLQLLIAAVAFRAGMEWIAPSPPVAKFLGRALELVFLSGLAWLAMRMVELGMVRLRGQIEKAHRTFSYSVLPLTTRVLKIIIVLLAIAAVLSSWGYNTTTILAGLGVGGVAIALAAQKTIENLFGGVAVITDRPVTVGDFCKFGDRSGTVEDIGLRSVRIRTLDRSLLTVPNGQFATMTLENFSPQDKLWFHLTLNLRQDTTAAQIRSLLEAITGMLSAHPKVEAGTMPVRFVGVGTCSLDVEIFAYILTSDGDEFMKIRQELLLWILDAVDEAGTALAIPAKEPISGKQPTPEPSDPK